MDAEDENAKKNRGRSRGGSRTRGRGRGRTRGRTKKAVKVIESDDEDNSQQGDENAMDTGPEPESQEEAPLKNQPSQQLASNPHAQQSQHEQTISPTPVHPPATVEHHHHQHQHIHQHQQQFDLEADISKLEAPTFTTINRGPPEPMLRLRWDHRVNLIGEKVLNPMIHCCDKCLKPILIYGRMIPCKHVFCLLCAKKEDKVCPRCMEKVNRVEQTGLGTVFMCTHGGTRYGNAGCRRTYLSQRDLQAHINHRHVAAPPSQAVQSMQLDGPPAYMQHAKNSEMLIETQLISKAGPNNRMKSMGASHLVPIMGNDPRVNSVQQDHRQPSNHRHFAQNLVSSQQQSSNAQMRSNLITVNIQDTTMASAHEISQQQGHHYYHPADNHVNANLSARHVVLSNQAPPQAPPQVNYASYNVGPPPPTQAPAYYGPQQHAPHPSQIGYVPAAQQQPQPYGPRSSSYVQDGSQYAAQQPQPVVPPPPQPQQQQQWNQHQHQQQFYR